MAKTVSITWSPKAVELIAELRDFLIQHLEEVKADDYINELFNHVENKLDPNPERYPPCRNEVLRMAGCRCLLYRKKYVIVYEIPSPTKVNVLGVIHSRRSPKEFEKLIN